MATAVVATLAVVVDAFAVFAHTAVRCSLRAAAAANRERPFASVVVAVAGAEEVDECRRTRFAARPSSTLTPVLTPFSLAAAAVVAAAVGPAGVPALTSAAPVVVDIVFVVVSTFFFVLAACALKLTRACSSAAALRSRSCRSSSTCFRRNSNNVVERWRWPDGVSRGLSAILRSPDARVSDDSAVSLRCLLRVWRV